MRLLELTVGDRQAVRALGWELLGRLPRAHWPVALRGDRGWGTQANMAKLLAADASWEAANACLQFHGGYGFACEYDVERKFRETRLYQVAPISTNLILSYVAEHVLGLPRSF